MEYEYLFPELLEEDEPSFFDEIEDLSMPTKGGIYYPKQCPPYKCIPPCKPRYCRPKYPCLPPCPPPCPPIRPKWPPRCYPLYPLPQCPRPCYPCYPRQRYPPQWLYPRPFPCGPQKSYYPSCQLPCPPYWRPCYPKYQPQYPCDFLELY